MSEGESAPARLAINWVQVASGGLAAMSSAVLLSTIGVAGTIIGAALGSIVLTLGSAIYSHYLAASRARVAAAREAAARAAQTLGQAWWSGPAQAGAKATADTAAAEQLGRAAAEAAPGRGIRWRELVDQLPWRRLLGTAAAVFVVVMAVILSFEQATGRALSSYTGGTGADGPRTSLSLFGGDAEQEPADPADDDGGTGGGRDGTGTEQEPMEGRIGDVPEPGTEPAAEETEEPVPEETEEPVPEETEEPVPEETVEPTELEPTPEPAAPSPPATSPTS